MPWQPDRELAQLIDLKITDIVEPLILAFDVEQKRIEHEHAARGTLRSGATVVRVEQAAAQVIEECGRGMVGGLSEMLSKVYGSVPLEAVPWLKETITRRIDGLVKSFTSTLAQRRERLGIKSEVGGLNQAAEIVNRHLRLELGTLTTRARLHQIASGDPTRPPSTEEQRDVFISHAGEDRDAVAKPIADGLTAQGRSVWLADYELRIGDRLFDKIDAGLQRSRFGVVILSPSFFAKNWPRRELAALAALEEAEGGSKILPVWHDIDSRGVAAQSPLMAAVFAAKTSDGISKVIEQILKVL